MNIVRNFLIMLINLQQMRLIQKTAKATDDLTGNKIGDRITKVSQNSQQNNSEPVSNENDKELPKERYISLEEKQNVIDDLRLK